MQVKIHTQRVRALPLEPARLLQGMAVDVKTPRRILVNTVLSIAILDVARWWCRQALGAAHLWRASRLRGPGDGRPSHRSRRCCSNCCTGETNRVDDRWHPATFFRLAVGRRCCCNLRQQIRSKFDLGAVARPNDPFGCGRLSTDLGAGGPATSKLTTRVDD